MIELKLRAKSATFRIADEGKVPLEEVTVVSKGRFKGRELTSLQTVRIYPTGKASDIEEGSGILYLKGSGRATYRVLAELRTTTKWRERVKGGMSFGKDCTGGLKNLARAKASFVTLVNSKGESITKVRIPLHRASTAS